MSHKNKHQTDSELLWEKIKGIEVAMLTTMETDGTIHSRPMVAPQREFDGDLWFLTMETAPKGRSAERHQEDAVNYVRPADTRFIAVTGAGELLHDQAAIKKVWTSSYQPWRPTGPDDPSLGLLKAHVASAGYWQEAGG